MAIYEINNGELLRIARSIDGKLQQRYISLKGLTRKAQREARRRAKEIDQTLSDAQQKAKQKRVKEAKTGKRHATGVRGISIVNRPNPAYRLQVQISGVATVREFSIQRMGNETAWKECTRALAKLRGYPRIPHNWPKKAPYRSRRKSG